VMSPSRVEIVRRCWEGLEEDPPRLWLEFFDEEVELRNPPEFPLQGPFHGHDGVRKWAAEVWEVITGLHHELEEIIEGGDGETIVSVQRTQGRMRHTELPTNIEWATVWTFREGKVLRGQGYLRKEDALEVAGLRG
jgi:ketosteroid isomerase-like protein